MEPIKIVDLEKGIVEGWGIPYGGPVNGRDLDGEAFHAGTKFWLDAYAERPLLYQHGRDKSIGFAPVGKQFKAVAEDLGIWVQAQINMAHKYGKLLANLAEKGFLGFSSGAEPGSIKKTAAGMIDEWFWTELTITPGPANPFALISKKSGQPVVSLKAQQAIFDELGRLPNAAEAQELGAKFAVEALEDGPTDGLSERLNKIETFLWGAQGKLSIESANEAAKSKEPDMAAEIRRLRVQHERIGRA